MPDAFVFQINPKTEYRLWEALHHMPERANTIVLGDGSGNLRLTKNGATVYLWEAGGTGLVGRGTVAEVTAPRPMPEWQRAYFSGKSHNPDESRAVIQVDTLLKSPIPRGKIRKHAALADQSFFKNEKDIQGTVFHVSPEAGDALDRLIDHAVRSSG